MKNKQVNQLLVHAADRELAGRLEIQTGSQVTLVACERTCRRRRSYRTKRWNVEILLLPVDVGRLAGACLAADLRRRRAFLALLDDECFLRVRKLRCLHVIPLFSQPGNHSGKLQLQTVQFAGIRSVSKTSYAAIFMC